jgi:hypothetical protein
MRGERACGVGGAGLPACVTGGTGAAGGAVQACGRGLVSRCPGASHGRKKHNTQDGGGNHLKIVKKSLVIN